jgi:hypothetical protein
MHDHLSILLFKDNHYFRYSIATISDVPVSFTIFIDFPTPARYICTYLSRLLNARLIK